MLARVEPGYERGHGARSASATRGPRGAGSAAVAVGGGAVWVIDGTSRLARVDPASGRADGDRRRPSAARRGGRRGRGVGDQRAGRRAVLRIDPATDARDRPAADRRPRRPGRAVPGRARRHAGRGVDPQHEHGDGHPRRSAHDAGSWPRSRSASTGCRTRSPPRATTAWVANDDGTLSRLEAGAREARSVWVGESLRKVAVTPSRVWVTTTALDQQLPGGAG